MFRLYVEAERVKRLLSSQLDATISVEHNGAKLAVPIDRARFEELTTDLLSRTGHTTRALLATGASAWRDVSRLLLVGGATRMPMVYRMLQEMSGILPDFSVHPEEAVARGAALYAARVLAGKNQAVVKLDCSITDVNSHSLGVQGVEVETGRRINRILLPKNTPLPARITKRFITTKPGQRSLAVQVLEGESRMPRECTVVGTTIVRNLPPHLPQGSPVNITFQYATNGRLEIFVDVPGTTCRARLELENSGARDPEEVARWRQVLADHANLPGVAGAAGVDNARPT
jgi:molecular chaperone DnaK